MPDHTFPYFRHYVSDHLSDNELARCSLEAEGLFWRAVAMSHNGQPYGWLTDSSGTPLTLDDIIESKAPAILRGRTTKEKCVAAWKELLDEKRVRYHKGKKAWYINKMVRIGEEKTRFATYGRMGGNPALRPDARKPGITKADRWTRAVGECVRKLIASRALKNGDHFRDAMSAANDDYRDMGLTAGGNNVVGVALKALRMVDEGSEMGKAISDVLEKEFAE